MAELNRKRIAFLATDMVEQVELTGPWKAVEQAGGRPEELRKNVDASPLSFS